MRRIHTLRVLSGLTMALLLSAAAHADDLTERLEQLEAGKSTATKQIEVNPEAALPMAAPETPTLPSTVTTDYSDESEAASPPASAAPTEDDAKRLLREKHLAEERRLEKLARKKGISPKKKKRLLSEAKAAKNASKNLDEEDIERELEEAHKKWDQETNE